MNMADQIAFEEQSLKEHRDRFLSKFDGTLPANRLAKARLLEVSKKLEVLSKTGGSAGRYNKILKDSVIDNDWITVAYIGISELFKVLYTDANTLQNIIHDVGTQLENNFRSMIFQRDHSHRVKGLNKQLVSTNSRDKAFAERSIRAIINDSNLDWKKWDRVTIGHVGSRIIRCVLDVYADIFSIEMYNVGNKSWNRVVVSEKYKDWKDEYAEFAAVQHTSPLPLMIKPLDWTGDEVGGYYTAALQVKQIKSHSKLHDKNTSTGELHRKAMNRQQAVAWKISGILEVLQSMLSNDEFKIFDKHVYVDYKPKELEIHKEFRTKDQEAIVKVWKRLKRDDYTAEIKWNNYMQKNSYTLKAALKLRSWGEHYYVYTCDMIGRMYSLGKGVNPQSRDLERALADFRDEVVVTTRGVERIKIHTANMYGIKGSEEDKLKWWEDNKDMISACKDYKCMLWVDADKPFCFLRACMEDFKKSSLPVAIDGVCNGIQHYSALFRDEVSAKHVGIGVSEPSDLYTVLLDKVYDKIPLDVLNRKVIKKMVLLVVFGSAIHRLSWKLHEFFEDNGINLEQDLIDKVTKVIVRVMKEEISCVLTGTKLLQGKVNGFMSWTTPVGFKVFQPYTKNNKTRINLVIGRPIRMQLNNPTEEVDVRKQKQAYPPNYIHSLDSSHAVDICNNTTGPIRCIFDDFAVHCNYVDNLERVVQDTFVCMYENLIEKKLGTLDINKVKGSKYFFC